MTSDYQPVSRVCCQPLVDSLIRSDVAPQLLGRVCHSLVSVTSTKLLCGGIHISDCTCNGIRSTNGQNDRLGEMVNSHKVSNEFRVSTGRCKVQNIVGANLDVFGGAFTTLIERSTIHYSFDPCHWVQHRYDILGSGANISGHGLENAVGSSGKLHVSLSVSHDGCFLLGCERTWLLCIASSNTIAVSELRLSSCYNTNVVR
mmetsp:Transcript_11441/g.19392  ORF Transcript_11441/g.19392 Transcript_11441/m.19392 type:complete len:202 (-) Transcript_11441:539-1144(-)